MVEWTVQINDLVGGYIVTNYPHPLSLHDYRENGDPTKRGHIIAECSSRGDANIIADLMNFREKQAKIKELPPEVVKEFKEFWLEIICPDEGWDLAQILRELHDYSNMLREVPKAYCHVTRGRISKPNTLASEVIKVHDEVCNDTV